MSLGHGSYKSILAYAKNPQAAYSLRRLGSYKGPLIKVRRSSDNTELDISASTSFQGLDTSALLTFVGSGDGYVSTWYDQSSNGRHATQTTLASQPKIVSNGIVNTINGRQALLFSGTQDLSAPATLFGSTFAVFQRGTNNQVISELSGAATYRGLFGGSGGGSTYWAHAQYAINGGTLAATQPLSASGAKLYQVTGAGVVTTSRTHRIGYGSPSWEPLVGNLCELIIYGEDISSQRSYIEWNQINFYNTVYTGAVVETSGTNNGLILYLDADITSSYPGSGTTWYDLSGNNNHGTLMNGTSYTSTGVKTMVFDGTNDFVTGPTFNASEYTLCVAAKVITKKAGAGFIGGNTGSVYLQLGGGSNPWQFIGAFSSSYLATTNQWVFLTAVQTQGNQYLYLNGTLIATSTGSSTMGTAYYIGKRQFQDVYLNCHIAMAQIYNRSLTSTEVSTLFNTFRSRYGI